MAAVYRLYKRLTLDGADVLVESLSAATDNVTVTGSPGGEAWYHVKAVSDRDVEDDDAIHLVRVAFDESGQLIELVPNAPLGLHLAIDAGGAVAAHWTYFASGEKVAPAQFNIYVATGDDAFDFSVVDHAVSYGGPKRYSQALGSFADGVLVRVVVRAEATSGAEEMNADVAVTRADAAAPSAASLITVEVTNE